MHNDPESLETRFPTVIPFEEIRVDDEEHTFRTYERDDGTTTTTDVYLLDKAPFDQVSSVAGEVGGEATEFDKGTDYQVVDNNNDGQLDSIDFDTGAGVRPDGDTTFFVTYRAESIVSRYIGSFQEGFDGLSQDMHDVVDSHGIDTASGEGLNQIGAMFGVLGKRRGRNDREYRAFLKSIVQSFKGRGTVDGINFAVAAGLGVDRDEIVIEEDFSENEYRVVVYDYNGHTTETVRELADLADPSGIAFALPIRYILEPTAITVTADAVTAGEISILIGRTRLGSTTLGFGPNASNIRIGDTTLGATVFGTEDEFLHPTDQ